MEFCWSTLMVADMEESLKFYQEIIGLTLVRKFSAGPQMEIAFLGDGETKIELICDQTKTEINVGKDICWGFEICSVDEIMTFLKEKGIEIYSGPFQPNPHTKFFDILDPNGMRIQLVEKIK